MGFHGNNAEGGSNGANVTAGGSAVSGTAFTNVVTAGLSTVTYDNSRPAHGSLAYALGILSGDSTFLEWVITATGTLVLRVYWAIDALPSQQIRIIDLRTSSATVLRVQTNTANKFEVQEGGSGTPISLTTGVFSALTYYRWELAISSTGATNAVYTATCYVGDSMTAFATVSTTTGNLGSNITNVRAGSDTTPIYVGTIWLDDLAYDPSPGAVFFGPVFKSASTSDSAHATDAATIQRAFSVTTTDTAHATDTATRTMGIHVTAADTAGATDTATKTALTKQRPATDVAAATDTATRTTVATRGPPDTAAATDVAAGLFLQTRSATDTAAATDVAAAGSPVVTVVIVDEVLVRDTDEQQTLEWSVFAADTAAASDSADASSRPSAVSVSDSAPATDTATGSPVILSVPAIDSAPATDVATASSAVLHVSTSDVAAAVEFVSTRTAVMARGCSDAAPATDVASGRATVRARTTSDAATASDSVTQVATARTSAAHDRGLRGSDTATIQTAWFALVTDPAPAFELGGARAAVQVYAFDSAPATDATSLPVSVSTWRVRAGRPTTTWQAGPVSTQNYPLTLADP